MAPRLKFGHSDQTEREDMEYYGLIYCNKQGDCVYSIVKAANYFDAEDKAEVNVKHWEGFQIYSVNWLDKRRIENGEVVFCGG